MINFFFFIRNKCQHVLFVIGNDTRFDADLSAQTNEMLKMR